MLVSAYKKIWTGLVLIEHFLNRNLIKEIQSPVVSPESWTVIFDTYREFRGEMLFLPDSLYAETAGLIKKLEDNINQLMVSLRQVIAARQADPEGWANNPGLLQLVNDSLHKVTEDYRTGLEGLRHKFQVLSRDLLLGQTDPHQFQ